MSGISFLGSRRVLLTLILFSLGWIGWKGRNKSIEVLSLLIVVCGGVWLGLNILLLEILRLLKNLDTEPKV